MDFELLERMFFMKRNVVLNVKGFRIGVIFWENHVNVIFPVRRVRKTRNGRVELAMADVCEVFSRHFKFSKDGEDRTCLEYFENDGIKHMSGPKKKIDIEERSPRRVLITIGGHVIRATISAQARHSLYLLLPNSIGNDFTFNDLCRALPEEFDFDKRYNVTHIRCIK